MKICITNAAEEPVEFREGDKLEELLADIPEEYGWFVVEEVTQVNEVGDPVPPLNMPRTKVAIFNANGYPVQVLEGAVAQLADMVAKLPPTQKALTIAGTQWELVEMAGDLLHYDDMVASIQPGEEA